MVAAARLLAYTPAHDHMPDVVCTLLYILAVIATIIAFVGLLFSLIGGRGGRWGAMPLFTNWLYAAAVALIAWLLLAFLC